VRLRYGYIIRCDEVVRDEAGEVVELRCTYDPETRGGAPDGRTVKGTIHWVSAAHARPVRGPALRPALHGARPEADEDVDFRSHLNPDSLVVRAGRARRAERARDAEPGTRYQFERLGYFCSDPVDSRPDALVFNRTVTLRDTWAKRRGLRQISDPGALAPVVAEVLAANAAKAQEYRGGKVGLLGFFVGQVMARTGGKANPELAKTLIRERLEG
jgi:hypothetical protein